MQRRSLPVGRLVIRPMARYCLVRPAHRRHVHDDAMPPRSRRVMTRRRRHRRKRKRSKEQSEDQAREHVVHLTPRTTRHNLAVCLRTRQRHSRAKSPTCPNAAKGSASAYEDPNAPRTKRSPPSPRRLSLDQVRQAHHPRCLDDHRRPAAGRRARVRHPPVQRSHRRRSRSQGRKTPAGLARSYQDQRLTPIDGRSMRTLRSVIVDVR